MLTWTSVRSLIEQLDNSTPYLFCVATFPQEWQQYNKDINYTWDDWIFHLFSQVSDNCYRYTDIV
jgi:hypothetical protein